MLNISNRNRKEYKSIIIRTRKGNTVGCYHFITPGLHKMPPSARQNYSTYDKCAERIEISWNVGGDVFIHLYERHPNGFEVVEKVVFDRKYITAIEIETDFVDLRDKIVSDQIND